MDFDFEKLEARSLAELRDLAKSLDVSGYSRLKKEDLILRLLAKDRAQRYASARDFLDDLSDVQGGLAPRSQASLPLAELRAGEPTRAVQPITPRSPASAPARISRIKVPAPSPEVLRTACRAARRRGAAASDLRSS